MGKGVEATAYRACLRNCKSLVLLDCSVLSARKQHWRERQYELYISIEKKGLYFKKMHHFAFIWGKTKNPSSTLEGLARS